MLFINGSQLQTCCDDKIVKMNTKNTYNILIGGEAGQGIITIGSLLNKSLAMSGFQILVTQSYESRIRGGHNSYSIRFSSKEIFASQETIDLLVCLDKNTFQIHKKYLAKNAFVIVDNGFSDIEPISDTKIIRIPYKDLSDKKFENTVALGIISKILNLDENLIFEILSKTFKKKEEEIINENKKALEQSFNWIAKNKVNTIPINTSQNKENKIYNGNEAIALGTISAGIKFCSFYPMTPATSIPLTLISYAKKENLIVEQVEDEIAAINMAIGASFAGAPSMVATSGGGFALMSEGVSLAAMTETPLVIAVASRPGPATGLPTRTEQADLDFVLHAGHGEFPKAIFAPSTIEDCFYLTRKACFLAEKSQSPIFILTDQFLADSFRTVKPFDTSNSEKIEFKNQNIENYKRYKITENGISPRLIPGFTKNLVIADSDEHTEDGHLTEDLNIRNKMVEKRLKKYDLIKKEIQEPEYIGNNNPDILFITWGSTKGSAIEAAKKISEKNKKVSVLNFTQVWPINPDHFLDYFKKAKTIISIEGNALAQFTKLIKQETGIEIKKQILRYDGLPITPEYILRNLEQYKNDIR